MENLYTYWIHWQPVTGCTSFSTGCRNCISKVAAPRLKELGDPRFQNGFKLTLHEGELAKLDHFANKRAAVMVSWNGDIFHKDVPDEFLVKIFNTIKKYKSHVSYAVLTKRSERLMEFSFKYPDMISKYCCVGVEVDSPENYYRIEHLRKASLNGATKYLSFCPLTGPLPNIPNLKGITFASWVNELGDNSRPFKEEWAKELIWQCQQNGVYMLPSIYDPQKPYKSFDDLHIRGPAGTFRRSMIFQLVERTGGLTALPTRSHPLNNKFRALCRELKHLPDEELKAQVRQVAPEFFEP